MGHILYVSMGDFICGVSSTCVLPGSLLVHLGLLLIDLKWTPVLHAAWRKARDCIWSILHHYDTYFR